VNDNGISNMDDDALSMTPVVSDNRASIIPLRRLFDAWSGDRSNRSNKAKNPTTPPPLRFGAHSKTPKKSNTTSATTSRQRPQEIMMKENADPLFALASSPPRRSSTPSPLVVRRSITTSRDDDDEQAKQRLRRRRWKTGLMLAEHKTKLAEYPPPPPTPASSVGVGVRHGVLVTNNKKSGGSILCFVRYQGPPRHIRFPIGDDGIWPAGWWQREIAWTVSTTASSPSLSVDIVWFTPILQKPLTDLYQVIQFALLLRLYGGDDEERAYQHLLSLHEQRPTLPRIVH
jgi:hypothetical protein